MAHTTKSCLVRTTVLILLITLAQEFSHEGHQAKARHGVWTDRIIGGAAPWQQSGDSRIAMTPGDSHRDAGATLNSKGRLKTIGRAISPRRGSLMNEIGGRQGSGTVWGTTAQEMQPPLSPDSKAAIGQRRSGRSISPAIPLEPAGTNFSDYVSSISLPNSCDGLSLEDAVIQKRKDCVQCLLASGANPRIANRSGLTPLHEAAKRCYSQLIEVLISSGSDVNARDRSGKTPLHYSVRLARFGGTRFLPPSEPLASIEAILAGGAHADARDKSGASVLHDLVHQSGPQVRKIMARVLEAGTALEGRTNSGWTPLHEASAYHWPENVKFLIVKGADVNSATRRADTPLLLALGISNSQELRSGEKDDDLLATVRILVEEGADVNARNDRGMSPLGRAVKTGAIDLAAFLRAHGAEE
jgi:ankyrin repeat protein